MLYILKALISDFIVVGEDEPNKHSLVQETEIVFATTPD